MTEEYTCNFCNSRCDSPYYSYHKMYGCKNLKFPLSPCPDSKEGYCHGCQPPNARKYRHEPKEQGLTCLYPPHKDEGYCSGCQPPNAKKYYKPPKEVTPQGSYKHCEYCKTCCNANRSEGVL